MSDESVATAPHGGDTPAYDNVVEFKNLSLRYGRTQALDAVSLAIKSHLLVGLIGPDGVGKSTLLSLITGSHVMQDGDLRVLGGDMRDAAHRNHACPRIAYMPQGLGKNLYFTLTVEENMQFFGRLFGYSEAERRARIDRLTKSTGLYRFLDRPAGKLSGGMKQKLGLCCSLIHDPELLILDEPTTGVDPLARRQFWDLVRSIRKENPNLSVMVATAYMDEAQGFDWLVAMNAGKILATGTPAELLERTGSSDLDAAFIKLLPEECRAGHKDLVVPPLDEETASQISIEAQGLTKTFGDFTAVDHVNFKIRRGEIFGFLGSNGCGKTTTMRMLTGLLPASEGQAILFGKPIDANDLQVRKNLGYMTQLFSLYTELTVRQNLQLYGRTYGLPEEEVLKNTEEMINRFGLTEIADTSPAELPMGMRQRLSLAAAVIHHPKILILDEPTSGVDPVARDGFWELIIQLSREDKVTVFVTTHFMNEAMRCDRISLMHAGRSLACDTPQALIAARGASGLDEAFIGYLEDADPTSLEAAEAASAKDSNEAAVSRPAEPEKQNWLWRSLNRVFDFSRSYTCCWREFLELRRDPIRLSLAIFGALMLMIVIGYGINMDVENLKFAVLDHDHSIASHNYQLAISGSRYFVEREPIKDFSELDTRLKSGELNMIVEIPADFGKKVERGDSPEVAFWVDGGEASNASTVNGYIQQLHGQWNDTVQMGKNNGPAPNFELQSRFRYNPDVMSLPAMVPGVIPVLLMMIPAILAALSVVREKEQGSIINLYVTPLSRAEFLLGKQLPYVGFAIFSATLLILFAVFLFDVPPKGSVLTLYLGLVMYCVLSTGIGLLASSVTKSQIAVVFMTMIGTITPAAQMCGLIKPVTAQTGIAKLVGDYFPTTHMLTISRGVFNKALDFGDLSQPFLTMLIEIPIILGIGILLQRKQEA